MTLLVGLWTTAQHHLIVFIVKTSSTSTREMLFCFFLLPFNVLKSENVTLKKQNDGKIYKKHKKVLFYCMKSAILRFYELMSFVPQKTWLVIIM